MSERDNSKHFENIGNIVSLKWYGGFLSVYNYLLKLCLYIRYIYAPIHTYFYIYIS